jgi:5-methylcytosine-specific restriction endonuclease McrA
MGAGNSQKFHYKHPRWLNLRRKALARDGWRCTVCSADVRGKGAARVDHIVPVRTDPTLAWTLSNLRTLCPSCDNKRHSEKGGRERPPIGLDGYPEGWV